MRYPLPRKLFVPIIVVISSACSSSPGGKDPMAGGDTSITHGIGGTVQLTIEVRLHPLGPVELVGHESTAPVAGAIVTILDQQGREVVRAQSDTAGRTEVSIAQGEYRLVMLSCPGGTLPEPFPFLVQAGTPASIQVLCDTERQ